MDNIASGKVGAPFADHAIGLRAIVPGLDEALRANRAVDVTIDVPRDGSEDDIDGAITVAFNPVPGEPGGSLSGLPTGQSFMLARDILQHVRDYRGFLRDVFGQLEIGGWLVITVPHQFLAERKFRRPSRYGRKVERFYTPGSLLLEVQEALDPTTYRVRLLADDDAGYDYQASLGDVPAGGKRIILGLQRIERPSWADAMGRDDDPRHRLDRPDRVLTLPADALVDQQVFRSSTMPVETILVLKLDHRGDFLLSQPALGELRQLYRHARITLLCASWNEAAARRSGVADEVLVFDFVAEDASADDASLSPELASMRLAGVLEGREFGLAIDLSAHEKFRHLLAKVKARHRAGFDRWNKFPFLDIRLCLPSPSEEGVALQGLIAATDFNTRRGVHKRFAIDFTRRYTTVDLGEYLLWGPYQKFGAGDYVFEILTECLEQDQELGLEICRNRGKVRLFSTVLTIRRGGPNPKIELTLDDVAPDLEFRLSVVDSSPLNFRFYGVGYERAGVVIGIHQMEAMHLLVQLVNARLSLPYNHDVIPA